MGKSATIYGDTIDTSVEECFLLRDLARILKPRVSKESLRRWCKDGIVIGAEVVRMEYVRLPSGIASSSEAYRRFVAALTLAKREVEA